MAPPKLNVLQVIYMIAAAWDELPASVIFHCWQKVGLVEALDRDQDASYTEYMNKIQQATHISISSLLDPDLSCHSGQVEEIVNRFLDYDEDAPDINASPDTISTTDIIHDLQARNDGNGAETDSSTDSTDPAEGQVPEPISISLAKSHIGHIVTLLERFSTNTLPVAGSQLPISTAIYQLQKIQQGFQEHEMRNKKQASLTNWLQLGSSKPPTGNTIPPQPDSLFLPQYQQTPDPPLHLSRFSPIAGALMPDTFPPPLELPTSSSTYNCFETPCHQPKVTPSNPRHSSQTVLTGLRDRCWTTVAVHPVEPYQPTYHPKPLSLARSRCPFGTLNPLQPDSVPMIQQW